MAVAMIGLGMHLAFWPSTLLASRFSNITITISQSELMAACLVVGTTRLFTLITSGLWLPWCARVRALSSVVASAIWLQMALALMLNVAGPPSPGMPVYLALFAGELISIARARCEANGRR
jgi:hypothetical protein